MFCSRLKALRKARGLSQQELGDLTELGQSNISAWERGGRQPLADGLIKLATFFNCSVDDLLDMENSKEREDILIMEQEFNSLDESDQEKVRNFIKNLRQF